MIEAKEKDKNEDEEVEKYLKPFKDEGNFNKIFKYNDPIWLIFIACIFSAAAGFTQPYMGIVFAKVMNLLTVPPDVWAIIKGPDYLEDENNYWVI